jgi:hypothetical protein
VGDEFLPDLAAQIERLRGIGRGGEHPELHGSAEGPGGFCSKTL